MSNPPMQSGDSEYTQAKGILPPFPLGKNWLLDRLNQSDYRVNEVNFCYGFSWMALFAILLNDLENFNKKLILLLAIHPENFPNEINNAKRKIINGFITARKKIQSEMSKEMNFPDNITSREFERALTARQKEIFWEAVHLEILRLKAADEIIQAQIVIDMLSFLEGIELYQNTKLFYHFIKENTQIKRTLIKSIPNTSLKIPRALEDEGGMSQVKLFSGIYDHKNLVIYFQTLRKIFSQDSAITIPLALTLNTVTHTITIGYVNNKWVIFDSNGIDLNPIDEDESAAEKVFCSLSSDLTDKIILSTKIYATKKNEIAMEKHIHEWQALPQYLEIHQA